MVDRPTGGITPFLVIRSNQGQAAVAFYEAAFAAVLAETNVADDGLRLLQAGLRINDGWLMLSDEFPEWRGHGEPEPAGITLHLQIDDADAWMDRAVAAGAVVTMPVADQFWGDRYGQVRDPFGHSWSIGSPIKT